MKKLKVKFEIVGESHILKSKEVIVENMFSEKHVKAIKENKIKDGDYVYLFVKYDHILKKLMPVYKDGFVLIQKCKQNESLNLNRSNPLFRLITKSEVFQEIKKLENVKDLIKFLKQSEKTML